MSTSSSEPATPEYPTLTLDDREPPQLLEELVEYGYEVEVKHLSTGDFEGQTVIGEIKRGEDLFSSIVDQRIFNQAKRMHATNKTRFLILAGNITDERFRLKPVLGALMELVYTYEIAILPVPNLEATIAYVIHQIMAKVDNHPRRPVSYVQTKPYTKKLTRPLTVEMLMCIPGIGSKQAYSVVKSYSSIAALLTASVADIQAIEGIGPKRAQVIYDAFR